MHFVSYGVYYDKEDDKVVIYEDGRSMEALRKLLGHGRATKATEEPAEEEPEKVELPEFEDKDVESYPPQFESLVNDYNRLHEAYSALRRLTDAYETSLQEANRANDLLLIMNANLTALVRSNMEEGTVPREYETETTT